MNGLKTLKLWKLWPELVAKFDLKLSLCMLIILYSILKCYTLLSLWNILKIIYR